MGAAQHTAFGALDPGRFVADQPRPGETRQAAKIYVAIFKRVMAGDPTRQHSGIRCFDVAGDKGHTHARHRPHAETFQRPDVGVAAADEHKILIDRNRLPHLDTMP